MKSILEYLKDQVLALKRKNLELSSKSSSSKTSHLLNADLKKIREMEKENQIMMYQISVKDKIFEFLCSEQREKEDNKNFSKKFEEFKQKAQEKILQECWKTNNEILKKQILLLNKRCQDFQDKNKCLGQKSQRTHQAMLIYKRKCEQYDSFGGRPRFEEYKQQLQVKNDKIKQLQKQLIGMDNKIQELQSKLKIMIILNKQTQDQLADILSDKKRQDQIQSSKGKEKLKQNMKQNIQGKANSNHTMNTKNEYAQSNIKIEMYALRQELRNQKNRVKQLQKNNKAWKDKLQERELFYSKMVSYR